ncbi:MAG: hypothetical protein DWQ02_25735 [Bacteroidetes bacterium]|nr:MAG: hypothetical protein DWQ02_25735 [Bacteroidota bacterium]
MKKNRDIWPNYKDRYGNAIPKPQYRSNFSQNLLKAWKLKGPLPKGKGRKWEPFKSPYPLWTVIKSWGIMILLTGIFSWLFIDHFLH